MHPRAACAIRPTSALEKRGTDVVIVGDAVSDAAVPVMDVAVRVRAVTVPLRVHGERVYYRSLGGIVIGPAAPFERKPHRVRGGIRRHERRLQRRRAEEPRGARRREGRRRSRGPPRADHRAPGATHPGGRRRRPSRQASAPSRATGYRAAATPGRSTRYGARRACRSCRTTSTRGTGTWRTRRSSSSEHLRAGDPIAILGMTPDGPLTFELPALSRGAARQDERRSHARGEAAHRHRARRDERGARRA